MNIIHRYTSALLYSGVNLRGAYLRGANLGYADLMGANLRDANLRDTDLGYADLRYANLRYANLGYADLRGADLRGADLRDANLRGANLRGADLGGQWVIQGGTRQDGYFFMLTSLTHEGIRVKAGCRNFTIAEARNHWVETRGDTPLGNESLALIDGMIAIAKIRGYTINFEPELTND